MAYNQNIPQATDQISQSQSDILNNFQAIYNVFGVNHVNFNTGLTDGKHAFVEFPTGADQVTTAGEVGLYCVTSTFTLEPELKFKKELGSVAPITSYELTSAGYSVNGWSRLPSGILLKWGSVAVAGAGNTVITFPVGVTIPVYTTTMYTAFLTPASNITLYVNALNLVSVTVNSTGAGNLYYLVMGV